MKRILVFCLCILTFTCTSCTKQDDPYTRFKGNDLYLKSGEKELFWFSGIHNNNPEHEMFDDIKKQFESFQPEYVLVEGNYDKNIYISERNAKLKGESAYVAYLSNECDIKVESIEPPLEMQTQLLLKTYNEDAVLAMYILRQIYQIQRESKNREISFFEYMVPFVQSMISQGFSYRHEDIDNHFIVKILEPYIQMEVNNSNWKELDAGSLVYDDEGILHSIYTDVLNYRDEYSVTLISDKLKDYNRIFIMMGADHIKAQEEELRKVFKEL